MSVKNWCYKLFQFLPLCFSSYKYIWCRIKSSCTAIYINILMDVISAVGENLSWESRFSNCENPFAIYSAINCSLLFGRNFSAYIHLPPILFLPLCTGVSSWVLFTYNCYAMYPAGQFTVSFWGINVMFLLDKDYYYYVFFFFLPILIFRFFFHLNFLFIGSHIVFISIFGLLSRWL